MKALQFSWFTAVSFCTALFPATNSIPLQFLSWNFLGKAKLKRYVWRSRGYLPAFFEPGSPLIKEAKSGRYSERKAAFIEFVLKRYLFFLDIESFGSSDYLEISELSAG